MSHDLQKYMLCSANKALVVTVTDIQVCCDHACCFTNSHWMQIISIEEFRKVVTYVLSKFSSIASVPCDKPTIHRPTNMQKLSLAAQQPTDPPKFLWWLVRFTCLLFTWFQRLTRGIIWFLFNSSLDSSISSYGNVNQTGQSWTELGPRAADSMNEMSWESFIFALPSCIFPENPLIRLSEPFCRDLGPYLAMLWYMATGRDRVPYFLCPDVNS